MILNYWCADCAKYFGITTGGDIPKVECTRCGSKKTKHVGYKVASRPIIRETDDPISAKSDGYWSNAERERLRHKRKRQDEHQEKLRFDDAYRRKEALKVQRKKMFDEEED